MSSFSTERSQACLGWGLQDRAPTRTTGQGEPQSLWWSLHRTTALARRAVLHLGSAGPSHTLLHIVDMAWTKIFTFTSVLTLPIVLHILMTVLSSSCWPFCHVCWTLAVAIYLEEEIPSLQGWKEALTRAKEKVRRELGVGGVSCIAYTCNQQKYMSLGNVLSLNWSGYKSSPSLLFKHSSCVWGHSKNICDKMEYDRLLLWFTKISSHAVKLWLCILTPGRNLGVFSWLSSWDMTVLQTYSPIWQDIREFSILILNL